MSIKEGLLLAVRAKHAAVMQEALINIDVYENSVGIGEHPDLVESVEAQVDKYVHALEMVEGVDKILNQSLSSTDRLWKDYEHLP